MKLSTRSEIMLKLVLAYVEGMANRTGTLTGVPQKVIDRATETTDRLMEYMTLVDDIPQPLVISIPDNTLMETVETVETVEETRKPGRPKKDA